LVIGADLYGLFRDCQGIIDLDAKVPDGAFDLGVSEQELDSSEISCPPIDHGRFCEIQEAALKAAGCEVIRSEKRSGTSTVGRAELQTVLDFLRSGDVLMLTRIDRLAQSIGGLQDIVGAVKEGRRSEGDRATDRYQHRGRQVLPRYARRASPSVAHVLDGLGRLPAPGLSVISNAKVER
jgi:hypothetical protein